MIAPQRSLPFGHAIVTGLPVDGMVAPAELPALPGGVVVMENLLTWKFSFTPPVEQISQP